MSQEASKSVQFELDDKNWEILEPSSFEKLVSDDELFSQSDAKGQQNLNLKSSEDFENNLPLNGDISPNLDNESDLYNSEDYSDVEYFDEELIDFDAFPQIRNTKKYKTDIKHSTTNIISPKNAADKHMKSFIEILNSLKYYIKAGEIIKGQTQLRKHPLAKYVLDRKTCKIIHELFNKKYLMQITHVLKIGKDYITLHAYGKYYTNDFYTNMIIKEIVLKIYKPSVSQCLKNEKGTKHKLNIKLARECAQKQACKLATDEMWSIRYLHCAVIPHPGATYATDHVIFLDFIGIYEKSACNLMEANMSTNDYISAYKQVIEIMKTLYRKHGKVYKDLTEYKILWHEEKCFIIGWNKISHITLIDNWNVILMKNCKNITEFFIRKRVPEVLPSAQLFHKIVGKSFKETMKSK